MIAASPGPVRSMFCSSEAASMRSSQERMPSLAATRLPCCTWMTWRSSGRLRRGDCPPRPRGGGGGEEEGPGVGRGAAPGAGAEGGEQRPDDGADLQRAEDGGVQLRYALQKDEDAVALLDAQVAQHVGPLVGKAGDVLEGVGLALAALALPEDRRPRAARRLEVAVDGLIGDVQPAGGETGPVPPP